MRNAKTVLGIVQNRGKRGLPLEDIYRELFNPDLLLLTYGYLSSLHSSPEDLTRRVAGR